MRISNQALEGGNAATNNGIKIANDNSANNDHAKDSETENQNADDTVDHNASEPKVVN